MHAASATEGVPISLSTIFDGLGTLILESSSDVKNFIGHLFSFDISKIAFSSFFKSTLAKPAIDNGDSLLVFKNFICYFCGLVFHRPADALLPDVIWFAVL